MRTIVVGDVHGCLDELQELIDRVAYVKGQDRLVFVGDLTDRGPDPSGCVRFARELGAEAVKSNHDEKHVRFRKHEVTRLATGKKNPMRFPPDRVTQNAAMSDDDIVWLESLPMMLSVSTGVVVVHAGLEPAFSADAQSDAVIRVRFVDASGEMVGYSEGSLEQPSDTVFWSERWKGPESVIYGHAVHSMTDPRVDEFPGGKCYGIDTGCVFGGRLTAMVMDAAEPEFVQVQARQEYLPYSRRRADI